KVPQGAVQRIACSTRGQQPLHFLSIQTFLPFHEFDLRQYGLYSLAVTRDRNRFAASGVLAAGHGDDDNACFSATAARNAQRLVQGPALFVRVDPHCRVQHYPSFNSTIVVSKKLRVESQLTERSDNR